MLTQLVPRAAAFLTDFQKLTDGQARLQQQLSSGVRIAVPSDDFSVIPMLAEHSADVSRDRQLTANLAELQTEMSTADSALQSAASMLAQVQAIAAQGAQPFDSSSMGNLARQAKDILGRLVEVSATRSGDRFIFSGDLDQQRLYTLDAQAEAGVALHSSPGAARGVFDADGNLLWRFPTAAELFDSRDSAGRPASENVFAAVNALVTALERNDSGQVLASIGNLKSAGDHLNRQLAHFGFAENRISAASESAAARLLTEQQQLSSLRDADVASLAVQLAQVSSSAQAAISAESRITGLSLFNFLG